MDDPRTDQPPQRVRDPALARGETRVGIDAEALLEVLDDEARVADLLPLVFDVGELPLGTTERCRVDDRRERQLGELQPDVELQTERADRRQPSKDDAQ